MRIFRIGKLKSTPDEVFGTHSRILGFKPALRLEWRSHETKE